MHVLRFFRNQQAVPVRFQEEEGQEGQKAGESTVSHITACPQHDDLGDFQVINYIDYI